ncbi:hypothetical protein HWC33_gp41 [Microbacterium phage TinyTimothy]|uniref:Uncharacterized protein n=1 Tax=Microbacterium phage TinyTimothy TaxID=2583039 RepID=A0A4Y6EPU5_9CAUD|nr:hypothetical protein HWC33_gp41 [Microbacterium phage TinyTimothy]QDF16994.1 hypothetical protein SEA_TINYTIMOTHY_41 [Microbacterium phage TinyTimothy]
MAFWDDLIRNISGQSNTPARKTSQAPRRATTTVSKTGTVKPAPVVNSGGGGGRGGMASFSVSAPAAPTSRRTRQAATSSTPTPAPTPESTFGIPEVTGNTGDFSPKANKTDGVLGGLAAGLIQIKKPEANTNAMADRVGEILGQVQDAKTQQAGSGFTSVSNPPAESDGNPFGEFGNFLRDAFTVKPHNPNLAEELAAANEKAAAQKSEDRDVGDRLPALWDNTLAETFARPFIPFDENNANDLATLTNIHQSTDSFQNQYTPGNFEVRQLSQEEWDRLDVKTQQAITANYALYQAAQADNALESQEREEGYDDLVTSIFGSEGGSDTYAPNTIRVLSELGYTNLNNDLDNFLNGGAILSENELLNGVGNEARLSVLDELQNSVAWENSNLVPMLEEGTSLIESLRQGDALSADTLRLAGIEPLALYDIDPERMDALNGLMQGMASRDLWAAFETDAEAGDSFQADFDAITSGMDPSLVARYFRENYPQYFQNAAYGDANTYMTPEEFYANWLS